MKNKTEILNGDDLSLGEVALLRGVTRSCVLAWMAHGLKHKRVYGRIFIRRVDAVAFTPAKPGKKAKLTEAKIKRAADLRLKGMTFDAIGVKLGVTGAAVWKALEKRNGTP